MVPPLASPLAWADCSSDLQQSVAGEGVCAQRQSPAAHPPGPPLPPRPRPPAVCAALQISPTHLRGTLGSINQLCICLGILAALLVNVALPAAAWRTMFALSALPAALLGVGAWPPVACWRAPQGSVLLLLPRQTRAAADPARACNLRSSQRHKMLPHRCLCFTRPLPPGRCRHAVLP